MKKQTWIVVTFALVAAGQWVGAQGSGGTGSGGAGGGGAGSGGAGSGGTNTVRRVRPNNGYARGVANYGVNTITIGGRNTRTITPRIMVQNFSLRGQRIMLRGGLIIPLSGGGTGGGGTGGGGGTTPPGGGGIGPAVMPPGVLGMPAPSPRPAPTPGGGGALPPGAVGIQAPQPRR